MIWSYYVRPADPLFRREHPTASEVVAEANGRPQRVVGVWKEDHAARSAAASLNLLAKEQLR